MMSQSIALAKKPHIVIATPGRLVDHLENTKGFSLRTIRYLVMDEADRILNMDFEVDLDKILKILPPSSTRSTYLYSATMTKKVAKLQRASLRDPIKVEVSDKYATVEKLQQSYLFIPAKFKDVYLVSLLNDMAGKSVIVFAATCTTALRLALLTRNLGFTTVPLHGQMSQTKRLGALNKFKGKARSILIATDVASRGLDIPHVDIVINYDIPTHSKDYIHRVGRTARAGRSGKSITFVTQYDIELYQRIEFLIGKQLSQYPMQEDEVMLLLERVNEADRQARIQIKEIDDEKKDSRQKRKKNEKTNEKLGEDKFNKKRKRESNDSENGFGVKKHLKKKKKSK